MAISKPEQAMKKALKDAGHTIADYIDPAPGEERDAEETLDELIGEVENDAVGQAIAQSDQTEGKPQQSKAALARELHANSGTEAFASLVEGDEEDAPPLGKTGS